MNQPTPTSTQESIQGSDATRALKIAVVSASWHKAIVGNAVQAIRHEFAQEGIPDSQLDIFEVPGAFELPLHAKRLAQSRKYRAVIACGFVTNGGIYRMILLLLLL